MTILKNQITDVKKKKKRSWNQVILFVGQWILEVPFNEQKLSLRLLQM